MPLTSVFVEFFGRVQGVGFRMRVLREAKALGLTGWVKNSMQEDLVEAVFCGEKDLVDKVISDLKNPLGFARVDKVAVSELKTGEEFKGFLIKY